MSAKAPRVVLVDGTGRVLLFNGHDPRQSDGSWWFTVGGGCEDGEIRARTVPMLAQIANQARILLSR